MPVKNIVRGQSVSYEMHERAKKSRREMTPEEKILWKQLRTNKLNGLHFRRQQIIHVYIADFYCHEHALIVEVDGGIHERQTEYDTDREAYLVALGFRIIRFTNKEVNKGLKIVLHKIAEACRE
jgi:very-short-patch-repair endonuclease